MRAATPPVTIELSGCPVCGLRDLKGEVHCPDCTSRPRTRAIPAMLDYLRGSGPAALPLLGFAMPRVERRAMDDVFPVVRSVSLAISYDADHETGVDARALTGFPDAGFAGHFSSLLFDYFEEHEPALAEASRVLAPGGVLMTHIASYRLTDDDEPPHVLRHLNRMRPEGFPSIGVGRRWFLAAIAAAGLEPHWLQIYDAASGERVDWFVAFKPPAGALGFAPGSGAP